MSEFGPKTKTILVRGIEYHLSTDDGPAVISRRLAVPSQLANCLGLAGECSALASGTGCLVNHDGSGQSVNYLRVSATLVDPGDARARASKIADIERVCDAINNLLKCKLGGGRE
jgi:hypothetical protein